MYLRIIRKDLKRKKTMNIILLLFVVLSAMFAASSVNNIVTVMNGLDYYFEKAGMADYYILSRAINGNDVIADILAGSEKVNEYRKDDVIFTTAENFTRDNQKIMEYTNASLVQSIDDTDFHFFDSGNNIISEVNSGKMYISGNTVKKSGLVPGDKITLEIGNTSMEFEFAGYLKDALFGSEMMGNPRMLISREDFLKIADDTSVKQYSMGSLYYIDTDNYFALEAETADADNILISFSNDTIKLTYFMNMLIAAIVLIVSIGLIVVSFVVLRFTIGFTIAEEFREIGVMKAVGLKNNSIRSIYLAKYFCISILGSVLGYFLSIPFAKILIASVSENMVLGNNNSLIIGILCCIAVVIIILIFSWNCTKKIKKLSPIDAVRNGQTGERFRKRGILHLGKSRLKSTAFLSVNDVLSQSKQFAVITAIFSICTVFVMILSVTANTIGSESLLYLLSMTESDVYYFDSSRPMDIMSGAKTVRETEQEIADILAENDMPGSVRLEEWYKLPVTVKGNKYSVTFIKCRDTDTADYSYTQGTPPMYENEIALTDIMADRLGVKIGDTVTIDINGTESEYVLTALFQSMAQTGQIGRLYQTVEIPDNMMTSAFSYQIDFDDNPEKQIIAERIEKLKDIFQSKEIYDTREFVKTTTGVSETLESVRDLVLILALIIIILIAVLMERSFISREKSEIALMKAIGFKSSSITTQHTGRFAISVIAAQVVAAVFCVPLLKLMIDPIFSMMGATGNIKYQFDIMEQFVIYPLIITATVVISTFLTAVYTRTIKASDTANIE